MAIDEGINRGTRAVFGFRSLCVGILAIAAAMLVGPLLAPPEFDWVLHSTSEQAGQGMTGAWLMRLGFVAYGISVVVAALTGGRSRPWVNTALIVFGLGLVATAMWSNASIRPGFASDMQEDWIHSLASGLVGTAFAAACAARIFAPGGSLGHMKAWIGLVVAVAIPLAMTQFPEARGLLQRVMFGYSFLFLLDEFRPR